MKNTFYLKIFVTVAFFFGILGNCNGQVDTLITRYFYVGGSILSYKGDLSTKYDKFTSGVQLGIRFNKKKRFNGNLLVSVGKVIGQNYDYQYLDNTTSVPNTYFQSNIFTFNYDLLWNIIKKEKFNLYISQGVGILRFNTKDEFGNKLIDKLNTRSKNETYNTVTSIFPTTIGLIYHFPKGIHIGTSVSWLRPSSDFIDNISALSKSDTKDNILAIRMSLFLPLKPLKVHHKAPQKTTKNERSIITVE